MPSITSIAIAQSVVIDAITNMPTLVGVLEAIAAPEPAFERAKTDPVALGPLALFAILTWEWPDDEPKVATPIKLELRTAGGKKHVIAEATAEASETLPRARLIYNITAIPIDKPGQYVFILSSGAKTLAEVPLDVGTLGNDGRITDFKGRVTNAHGLGMGSLFRNIPAIKDASAT